MREGKKMWNVLRGVLFGFVAISMILFVLTTGANAITVSNVTNKTPMATTVWILWNVSTEANNTVEYSINSDLADASFSSWNNNTSTPEIKLWSLQPNTIYYYRVWSYNATNESDNVSSSIYNFTTQECVSYKLVNTTDTSITGIDHPIQEAIDMICPSGGKVELGNGTHDVYDAIVISRGNITIQGTHDSEIRSHDPNRDIFSIPYECTVPGNEGGCGGDDWQNKPVLKNFLFKGFKVTSTYGYICNRNSLIEAWNVENITVEDILDLSYVWNFFASNPTGGSTTAQNKDIFIKNNIIYHSQIVICFSENIHIINNSGYDAPASFGYSMNRNNKYLYIKNNYGSNYGANANMEVYASRYWVIENNTFEGSQRGMIIFSSPKDAIIKNNTITGASYEGICIEPQTLITNITIINNRIYNNAIGILQTDFEKEGGSFSHEISDVNIINNVIYNNTGDGIKMKSEYVRLNITNNIIANNGGYGINYMDTIEPTTISYNDVWGNSLGNYNNTSAGTGDISEDPLFADPDNNDFHLKSEAGRWNGSAWVCDTETSPCIDAGDPNSSYSNEIYPHGQRINIGAYGNTIYASRSPYHKIYLSVPMTIHSNGEYSYPEPPIIYKDNQTVNITFNMSDTTNLTINSYTSSQINFTATNTTINQKMNITVYNGTFRIINGKKYEIKKDGVVQQTKTASDNKVVFTDIPVGSDYVITEESGGKQHKLPVARPVCATGIAILIVVAYWRYRRRRRRMRSGGFIVLVPGLAIEWSSFLYN